MAYIATNGKIRVPSRWNDVADYGISLYSQDNVLDLFQRDPSGNDFHSKRSFVRRWKMVDREAADAAEADHGPPARRTNLRKSYSRSPVLPFSSRLPIRAS
jgi:hypothetical protein